MAAQRRTEDRLEAVLLEVARMADVVDSQPRGRRERKGRAWGSMVTIRVGRKKGKSHPVAALEPPCRWDNCVVRNLK